MKTTTAVDALSRFECGFGRAEQFELGKSKARMMLVKNPAGYNQVINQISNDEEECKIAFLPERPLCRWNRYQLDLGCGF